MSENKFVITDAVGIKKKKESRQVKPLSTLQISLFIWVHSSIRAPPNNNQGFNISGVWLIRSSNQLLKSHVYKFDLALIQEGLAGLIVGKCLTLLFFNEGLPGPGLQRQGLCLKPKNP